MLRKFNAVLALVLSIAIMVPQGWGISRANAAAVGDTVMSSSFDSGTDGWFKRGSETVAQSTNTAQAGAGSLLATGRTATWNGPGVIATSALQPGGTYEFSIYAKLKEGTSGSATVELTINQQGLPSGDSALYKKIASGTVTDADWVLLQGELTVDERATAYQVYVQSTDNATVDYYIDSFAVKLVSLPSTSAPSTTVPADNVVLSQSFEDGQTGGWTNLSWGGAGTTVVSATYASEGTKSLKFSSRASRSSSPTIDLTSLLQSGHAYNISLKARLGDGTDKLHIASKIDSPLLTNKYPWLTGNGDVASTDWTTFAVNSYEVPDSTAEFRIWLESDSASTSVADIYIDEVLIEDVTPSTTPDAGNLDQSGVQADFENGQGDWVRRFGTDNIEISTGDNHTASGSSSLLTTVTQQYDGPLLNVLGKMHKGYKYSLSAWVKMAPGQSPTAMRISVQHGDSTFTNVSSTTTVTADNWVKLEGTFTLATTPTVLNAYVEVANSYSDARSFYMDDFALTYVGAVAAPLPVQTDLDQLKDMYADYFQIGAAVEPAQLNGDVHELLDYHYNSIVAENSMKPSSLNPSPGVWKWESADAIAQYAINNNLTFRLHTLAWHQQAAEWMFKDDNGQPLEATPANKQLVLDRLTAYIQEVARHFKNMGAAIDSVDVVNEVIDEGQPDGMRKSEWFRLTGTDFIRTAFTVARQELPNAKLYINDYNTQDPKKRDFLYGLATSLKAEGIPIDGVGHQTHINISGPSIEQISDSIKKFAEAGFDNQLTELDVSVYTNNSTSYDPIPNDILVKQGYRYKELFKELVRLDELGKAAGNAEGWISNVTLWGIADDHTWLHNRGTTRQDAPFPFDKQYQAKYAYWGMIEALKTITPSKLPITSKSANAAQGTPIVDHATDGVWSTVPAFATENLGTLSAQVKTLWDAQYLYVRVAVSDATNTATNQVELFVDGNGIQKLAFPRDHAAITEVSGGYVLETAIPHNGTMGQQVKFDVRVTDKGINDGTEQGGNGVIVSWSDPRSAQDSDSQGYGVLTYIAASKIASAAYGTPAIDGELDAAWANAAVYATDVMVEQHNNAVAKASFRTMWDEQYLYVYAVISDSALSDTIANAWEQDSIEVFVDQNNGKTSSYQGDDGQYRINYNNVRTPGGHASSTNYTSATKLLTGDQAGYVVETAIALDTITPGAGTMIGFDLQVNNDQDGGTRDSVFIWNDPTGQSYANTSRLGVLELAAASGQGSNQGSNQGTNQGTNPGSGSGTETEPAVPTEPIAITVDADGNVTATVSEEAFSDNKKVRVSIPYSLKPGDQAEQVVVYELLDNGKLKVIPSARYNAETGMVEFNAKHSGTYTVGTVQAGFADLHQAKWASSSIIALAARGIVQGISDDSFAPKKEVTRAEFLQMLVQTLGLQADGASHPFGDVKEGAWYYDAVSTAHELGIVNGTGAGVFGINDEISRQDMAVMTYRALLAAGITLKPAAEAAAFADQAAIGGYAQEAITALQQAGIINGMADGTFAPKDTANRAQAAVMLYHLLSLI